MKIQKLTIHNIASIEDAEIDFREEPLSGSDVFLITGKTGAGKSTILDSISLALYNTTPRIINASGNRVENNSDNLTLNDPRQLMRRETGEAHIILLFEGIDGKQYEAKWSVQRGKKMKVNVSMDNVAWSVKCLSDGSAPIEANNSRKYQEVQAAIVKAIGLEFDQFCRTTMLAQGEFTKFLKSPEGKKSEILSKITQFTEYTRIGQKIYEIDCQKKGILEAAIAAAGDTGLKPEEIESVLTEIAGLNEEIQRVSAKKAEDVNKKEWLEIGERIEDKEKEIHELEATLETENFKKTKQDIEEWDKSIEARHQLGIQKSEEKNVKDQEEALESHRRRYSMLVSGLDALQARIGNSKSEARVLNAYLDSEKANADIYSKASSLIEALKRIALYRREIAKSQSDAAAYETRISGELKVHYDAAQKSLGDAKVAETILANLFEILTAQNDTAKYATAVKKHQEEKDSLAASDMELAIAAENLKSMDGGVAVQEKQVEILKAIFERFKDTMDDWAKAMRSKITRGEIDVCPVCGQKIVDAAFSEDKISALYDKAKEDYDKAEDGLKKLKDERVKAQAGFSGKKAAYEDSLDRFAKDTSIEDTYRSADESCRVIGLSIQDPGLEGILSGRLQDCWNQLSSYGYGKIDSAAEVSLKKKAVRDYISKTLEPGLEKARKERDDAIAKKGQLEASINTWGTSLKTDIEYVASQIDENLWKQDPENYADNVLKIAADKYNKATSALDSLTKEIETTAKEHQNLKDIVTKIEDLYPEWASDPHAAARLLDEALSKAARLFADIQSAGNEIQRAKAAAAAAMNEVASFIQGNPGIDHSRLDELNSLTDIEDMKRTIADSQDKLTRLNGELGQLISQRGEMAAPSLSEDDTLESISKRISEAEGVTIPSLNQTVGAKNKILADDKAKKDGLAQLEQVRDAAQKDYDEWHFIAKELGDKEGKNFQTIAQSFLLDNLLGSANVYLKDRKLAERYTLKAVPNTLDISVEDAYQGYATRSTDSLSGGESFLVSLALALALSDIGEGLAVDTLFIDEGFGTLSGEPLTKAINVLRGLHNNNGRHIGIISHIEEVKENIPVQIQVNQEGSSSSSTVKVAVETGGNR